MNYSTLKEAYSIDSFDKEKKKSKKAKSAVRLEEFEDDISESSQKETKNNISSRPLSKQVSVTELPERPKILKDVQPHYDEELEKYLNVNDFKDNNLHYYPQDYTQSYQNTNYSSPSQHNTPQHEYDNEDRYEPKQLYQRPVSISYNANDQYMEPPVRSNAPPIDSYRPSSKYRGSGPGQSGNSNTFVPMKKSQYVEPIQYIAPVEQPQKMIVEQKDIFYKNLVNIGLFIFIGILIIFLCEQITEIAINIGMKKTMILLAPYMNANVNVRK